MKINREQIRERIIQRKDLLSNYTSGDLDSVLNLVSVDVNALGADVDESIKKFGVVYGVISGEQCEGSCDYQMSRYAEDLRNERKY